ncbi:hypothetical protein GCM10018793_40610 [Streptomyces sulfonofaciens]|uniref:Uncharacterized protein n=1 Tax=Streptomyces sulfonofaciens TaxID=68272 RepID=A0A919GCI3_9ACTN|nr:hypothetical protein [Streptomyces sulfonofaciens]GHH81964.1 hypothetical protein GCM10018793_40610 [Streptomyces sulfonofaciens]
MALIVGALLATSVPGQIATGFHDAVCRIVDFDAGGACDVDDDTGAGPGSPPGGHGDDPFEPAKCLLAQDKNKTTVLVDILFFKMSGSEELVVQQWSNGEVTVQEVKSSAIGAGAGISAGIPGLKDWGGDASLGVDYMHGSSTGGQWLFNKHKSGDPQADLEANMADAKQFIHGMHEEDTCDALPYMVNPISIAGCRNNANDMMGEADPESMPDVDVTKTTDELSGGVSFGKAFKKGPKDGKGDKGDKGGDGKKGDDGKEDDGIGSISADGLTGSMSDDVTVLRTRTGKDAGKITFVYTFSLGGKAGPGGQAQASRMQQVSVTYDAAAYDEEEKNGSPHHPQKLTITTSEESGSTAGAEAGAGANAGPVTIEVGGGGGKTTSQIHTESAQVDLSGKDADTVEDWLRGRGDDPASSGLPTPSDATRPLGPNATPIERLLHDKAQLSKIDYAANTDWWNASLGIGFGVALGEASLGFKVFGISVSHEHKTQTVTGDPKYAMAPAADGTRPWVDWKKCTQTSPVSF